MPIVFHGPPAEETEPAWVSSPDPNWYPNGIGDALHAIVDQLYGWGFSLPVRHRPVRVRVPADVDGAAELGGFDSARGWPPPVQARRRRTGPGSRRPDRPEPDHGVEGNLGAVGVCAAGVGDARGRQPVPGRSGWRDSAGGVEAAAEGDEGTGGGDPGSRGRRLPGHAAPRPRSSRPTSNTNSCRSTRPTWRCWKRRNGTPVFWRPRTGCRR